MSKNVTQHMYGGDRTRKMKLWKKQKEGKARMKERGRVNIPEEVFLKMVKSESHSSLSVSKMNIGKKIYLHQLFKCQKYLQKLYLAVFRKIKFSSLVCSVRRFLPLEYF
jgi:hypothetical protein